MTTEPNRSLRRTIRAAAAAAAGLLLVIAAAVWLFGAPKALEQAAAIGGPFTLQDGSSRTVTDQSFRGKYMLVYFGYTFCPDVCPTTLNDVAQALDKLGGKADRVQPLFITVDPARDTAPVMQKYTEAFSPRITGLTGTAGQIAAVAREYRVYYAPHKTGPNPGDYTMDHSSILYLMGPNGRFIGVIRADEGADQIAADLGRQLS